MSNLLRTLTVAGVLAAPLAANAAAAPAPAKAAPPTLADVFTASGISLSGAVDASYDYDDVDGAPAFHAFDTTPQGFALHQVNVLISKDFGNGVGLTVNPVFGEDANLLGYGENYISQLVGYTSNNDDFDLTQGYISFAAGPFTTILGRFVTLAGMEVINPAGNANASRSLLFYQQPLVHTGLRTTYKATDALSFTLGILDSAVGSNKTDNNSDVSFEAQAAFTAGPSSTYLTYYTGNEDATGAPPYGIPTAPPPYSSPVGGAVQKTDVVDLVSTLALGEMLSLGINADYITTEGTASGHAITSGVAGYATVKFGSFRVSPRVEYLAFDDNIDDGNDGWQREETLTLGYAVTPSLELLVEGRNDVVDEGFFALPLKDANTASNNDQTTATIKAILKF